MAMGVTQKTFQLDIVSAEKTLYSGPAHALAVSGQDGELGIRPGHSPLLSKLKPGVASFVSNIKDPEEILYISGGIVEVQPSVVTVLADTAMHGKDIDQARANEARRAAEANIQAQAEGQGFQVAQMELAKAVAQLRAIELTQKSMRR